MKTKSLIAAFIVFMLLNPSWAETSTCPEQLREASVRHASTIETDWTQTRSKDAFFDYWAKKDPRALEAFTRAQFDALMHIKHRTKRSYIEEQVHQVDVDGSFLAQSIHKLARDGKNFEEALVILSRSTVEAVLTTHPTQIQATRYRLLWQLRENNLRLGNSSNRSIATKAMRLALIRSNRRIARDLGLERVPSSSELDALVRGMFPGPIRKLTVREEAEDLVRAYFGNLYEASSLLRNDFIESMTKVFGNDPRFDRKRIRDAAIRMQRISTWLWDADGKSNVDAQTMREASVIQQSAVYRLHLEKLESLLGESLVRRTHPIELVVSALKTHLRKLANDPFNTDVITEYAPEAGVRPPRKSDSPSERVRLFFANWVGKLRFSEHSPLLEELEDDIRAFAIQNHVRQNSQTIRTSVEILFEEAGLKYDIHAIRRIARDRLSVQHLREVAEASRNPILRAELDRFAFFAQDPGTNGAVISADTRSLEDIERTLFLLEIAGLTEKVRYFPLIENMGTFREIEAIMQEGLGTSSLLRRQIDERSRVTHESPTLNIMFALSDTSRLGSQAAPHLMELKAKALHRITAPIAVVEFWGGGSQLARGGDWISDSKPIYTDQGNARDLKYDSIDAAFDRMSRHVALAIQSTNSSISGDSLEANGDLLRLNELVTKREKRYQELFFQTEGYRSAIEAYLLLGSMFAEAKGNSYGARPVSRSDDREAQSPAPNRLSERVYENPSGRSFDQVVAEYGLSSVLDMKLVDLFHQMRPEAAYAPPSIDQRAITIDNAFSETKFNQLAGAVSGEIDAGLDLATSARLLLRAEAPFQSYRRQKMAEVIAARLFNEESHLMRLPKPLRSFALDSQSLEHFKTKTRGRSHDELTVRDWIATIAYIHQTARDTENRNRELEHQIARTVGSAENPIALARRYARSEWMAEQQPAVRFGQFFAAWMHRRAVFGDTNAPPTGLSNLFPSLSTDEIARIEYLAWALHYEGQQLSVQVNALAAHH